MPEGPRRLAAVMLTDMVGFTALTQRDETLALRLLEEHRLLLRPLLSQHGGREVKTIGDAFLVEFHSVLEAAECAIEVQRTFFERNRPPGAQKVELRIGIHVGDVVHQDGDVYGDAVNVVSRIVPLAAPGGVCVSGAVFEQVRNKIDCAFFPIEPTALKGLDFTPELYRMQLPWLTAPSPPGSSTAELKVEFGTLRLATPLVDREEEIATLRKFVESASQGDGAALFLTGEAGIGKSRLASEVQSYAHLRGMRTFVGNCVEGEGEAPYAPWVEIVRRLVREETPRNLYRFCGPFGNELAKLAPELVEKIGPLPSLPAGPPAQERLRFYEGVTEFFEKLSNDLPVLLILEDLSWADAASLQLLRHLIQRLKATPLGVLGTYREVDLAQPSPLSDFLTNLNRDRLFRSVRLPRLEPFEVSRFIQQLLGDRKETAPAFAGLIYEKTGGNPFFVEEVLFDLVEAEHLVRTKDGWSRKSNTEIRLPPTVRKVIQQRLARLDEETLGVLRFASVFGQEFDFELLRKVTETSSELLVDLLDRGLKAGLIKEERRRAGRTIGSFRDRQIRETLYEDLSLARRRIYHLRVGEAFEEIYRDSLEEHSEELAHHFLQASDTAKSLEYSHRAADHAIRIYAYDDGAKHLRIALDLLEARPDPATRARVLERLGDVAVATGQLAPAVQYLREAAEIYRRMGEPRRAGDVLRRVAVSTYELTNDSKAYFKAFREARALLEREPEGPELARLLASAAIAFPWLGHPKEGRSHAEEALRQATSLHLPEVEMTASNALCVGVSISEKILGLKYLDRWKSFLRRGSISDPISNLAEQYVGASFTEISARGDWKSSAGLLEDLLDAARSARFLERIAYLQYILSLRYFEAGRTSDGRKACDEVWQLFSKYGFSDTLYVDALSTRRFYDGDLEGAQKQVVKTIGELIRLAPQHRGLIGLYQFAGLIYAEQGRYRGARQYFDRCKEMARLHEFPLDSALPLISAYSSLIEVLVKLGRRDDARQNLRELSTIVTQLNHDLARGYYRKAEGHIAAGDGRWRPALRAFGEAVRVWERADWKFWSAVAMHDLAVALSESGRTKKARACFVRALGRFRAMEIPLWIDRVAAQIERLPVNRKEPADARRTVGSRGGKKKLRRSASPAPHRRPKSRRTS